jgi:hypothetical protein
MINITQAQGADAEGEHETLYDYVDDESIHSLHARIITAVHDMEVCVFILESIRCTCTIRLLRPSPSLSLVYYTDIYLSAGVGGAR